MTAFRYGEGGFSTPVMVMFVAILVLLLGGVSVDLWRVVAEHREITTLVDGAAIAGATAVDEELLYTEPSLEPQLDEVEAVFRVCDYLARNGVELSCPAQVDVVVGLTDITVTFERDVDVTLLRLLTLAGGSTEPIAVGSTSTAVLQRSAP
jgi:uncharacterized membrane protein